MQFVTVSNLLSIGMLRQLRNSLLSRLRSQFLPRDLALYPATALIIHTPALDSRAIRESPAHSSAAGVDADGVLHFFDRGLRLEMVEHEVEIHAVGPAADENLKRLDTRRHTLVLETQFWQPFDIDEAFTRALINEHTSGITGIHLESLPAPGGLETRMSWGLARLGTAMECRERSVESFESGVLYAPVERSFDVREVLAYCRKRPALLSERD